MTSLVISDSLGKQRNIRSLVIFWNFERYRAATEADSATCVVQ